MWKQGVIAVSCARQTNQGNSQYSKLQELNNDWRHQVTCSDVFPLYTPIIKITLEMMDGSLFRKAYNAAYILSTVLNGLLSLHVEAFRYILQSSTVSL